MAEPNNVTQSVLKIQLGGKPFTLDTGGPAFMRRSLYFLQNKGQLTENERDILNAIGIDQEMEDSLKQYLPKFFEALPNCQSDVSMYLSKQCEIPYFVIWFSKFSERMRTKDRIQENKQNPTKSDYTTIVDTGIVQALTPPISDVDRLFELMRIPNI